MWEVQEFASRDGSHIMCVGVCGYPVRSMSPNLSSKLKRFKRQRGLIFQSYIHQRNALCHQCTIILIFKTMTRVLWSMMDIPSAEPAARKLLLKAPAHLICPNIVGIIIHPCVP